MCDVQLPGQPHRPRSSRGAINLRAAIATDAPHVVTCRCRPLTEAAWSSQIVLVYRFAHREPSVIDELNLKAKHSEKEKRAW